MRIDVLTIFPDYLAPLSLSLVGKAVAAGRVGIAVHDLRSWAADRHRTVDDTPYGGGPGMVMKPEPWGAALDDLADRQSRLLVPTPSGRPLTQALASELAREPHLIIACGRYEGIDARVVEDAGRRMRVEEISVGDYVLNGGEAAALVIVEAVVRLLPGVLGNPESLTEESHAVSHGGLLEYPVYTKPPRWRDLEVPEVLLSGHHAQIAAWRQARALAITQARRPDLLPVEQRPVTIAPAQPADAGELWTIEKAAFLIEGVLHEDVTIPPLTETCAELRSAITRQPFLVARRGSRLVGGVRGELSEDGTCWFISRLMVAPDQQGQGVGSRLLAAMEALAPSETRCFRLTTGANNAANLGFYAARGYVEVERHAQPGRVALVLLEKGPRPAAGQPAPD